MRSDADTSRDGSENLSEKEAEGNGSSKNEEQSVEEKNKRNALEGKSEDVSRDQNNTRVSHETRENDEIGAVNGQTDNDKKPTQDIKVNVNSSSVQDDKTTTEGENADQVSTRLDIAGAREGSDEARINDIPARDEKQPALVNDVQAREGTHNAENSPQNAESTLGNSNIDTEMKNNIKYTGVDKAFVNLLEEIEDDQTFFEEQLEKLEKQVESEYSIHSSPEILKQKKKQLKLMINFISVLEKSFTIGTNERRPTIRKLAKQLTKLQKLGLVA